MLINTSGGLTGGDSFDIEATAGDGTVLTLTTQAAERAYRSADGHAQMTSSLRVGDNATLMWLPQEMILFDGSALRRNLSVDLSASSRLLMVEPVVFGRLAMGESQLSLEFHDRIEIRRGGQPLYLDGVRIEGNATARLDRRALGAGMTAMASLLYVSSDAESHIDPLRAMLPSTGGATLLQPDVLAIRLLAEDSFFLRRDLLPILDRLSQNTLPASWRL